jgi:ABC-type Mn2+/Zn2+ transport system ATPase subunit
MTHPLLSIRDLEVELGGKRILNGVNADVARGKITALIGQNGSGKTTLLRSILREHPWRGQMQFHCGHDHHQHQPEHVGYVPQKLAIDARLPLTVLELFALTLQKRPLFLGISRSTRKRADDLLCRVKADHLLSRPVAKLSGGEMQRVLLSLAMDPHPELLLLDEPAAGIDFVDQKPFDDLLAEINRQTGVTILLVSHDLSMVSRHAHHVLCLKNGRIECQGSPHEVMTSEALAQTFGSDKRIYEHHHH